MNIIPYTPGMEITEPCFVAGVPNDVYHSMPGVSNSGLNMVARSLAHYKYRSQFKQTRAMEIGTAFHTALLEPERFKSEYMMLRDINDRRKSEYKEAAKVYGNENTLTASESDSVLTMLHAVMDNPDAMAVLDKEGHAELSGFAQDPETGIWIRARFDWLTTDGHALDVKKTQDARERAFQKSIHNYRYYCQDAMYSHVYELITGQPLEKYEFLAIEEQPPCANVVYELDVLAKKYGWDEYRAALLKYAEAVEKDQWPAYQETRGLIGLPEYLLDGMDGEAETNMIFDGEE